MNNFRLESHFMSPHGTAGGAPKEKISPEVSVRHFNPESQRDRTSLHQIDLATRDSTVDVSGGEDEIPHDVLIGWMRDPGLFAIDNKEVTFGFVWFTGDTNVEYGRKVNQLLKERDWKGREVREFNNGELDETPEQDAISGWKKSIEQYKKENPSSRSTILTAYTSDEKQGELFRKAGFRLIGTVFRYRAKMDDGTVDVINQKHLVFALDLASQK